MKIKSKIIYLSITMIAIASMLGLVSPNNTASAEEQTVLNGRVFYTTNKTDEISKIISVRLDGSDPIDIASSSQDKFSDVVISYDGRKIAYSVRYDGDSSSSQRVDVVVANADGSNQQIIVEDKGYNTPTSWTPSNELLVTSARDFADQSNMANHEIYKISEDGQIQTRLTNNDYADWRAKITGPNYDKIIFQSRASAFNLVNTLYSMNLNGGNVAKFLDPTSVADNLASTSYDGQRIVYFGKKYSTQPNPYRIRIISHDGADDHLIGSDELSYKDLYPTIAPENNAMYFISDRTGSMKSYVYDFISQITTPSPIETNAQTLLQIQPLTLRPSLKPNASTETNSLGQYNVSSNNTDAYDGLDLSSIQIISGNASVDLVTGIITTSSSEDTTYKVCSLSNPNLCSTFTIKSNLTTDVIGVPNTGYGDKI